MLAQTETVNGSFGKLYEDGEWLINVKSIEANVEINYEEVHRSGTRQVGWKAMNHLGTGTIGAYTTTYDFIRRIGQITDDTKPAFVTQLDFRLEDPENPELNGQWISLKGVQFQNLPLIATEVNTISEHELQFTFDGHEFL